MSLLVEMVARTVLQLAVRLLFSWLVFCVHAIFSPDLTSAAGKELITGCVTFEMSLETSELPCELPSFALATPACSSLLRSFNADAGSTGLFGGTGGGTPREPPCPLDPLLLVVNGVLTEDIDGDMTG